MTPSFCRRLRTALAAAAVCCLVAPPAGRAGVIAGYDPNSPASHATFDRFSGGYPTAPVANTSPSFIGGNYDLSGVGWSANVPGFGITLISPQHFLGAFHTTGNASAFPVGGQVSFVNGAGAVHSYTIQGLSRPTTTFTNNLGQQQTLPSDVMLGTLSAPIPAAGGVHFFPVA